MNGSDSVERYLEAERSIDGAELPGTDYVYADLRGTMISWAILNRANLHWASLVNYWTIPDQLIQAAPNYGVVAHKGTENT